MLYVARAPVIVRARAYARVLRVRAGMTHHHHHHNNNNNNNNINIIHGTCVRRMRAGMNPPPPIAMITSGSNSRTLRAILSLSLHYH